MSFVTKMRLDKRTISWISIAVLVAVSLLPALIARPAHAAQLGDRSIALDDTSNGKTDVNYAVSFNVNQGVEIAAVVVEFCSDSPIIGDACTAPTGFDLDATNLSFSGLSANLASPVAHANSTANLLIVEFTSDTPAADELFTITLGDGDTDRTTDNNNGVINPTNANTSFYARIVTFNTAQAPESYVSATPGTHLDDGGIAMSTANELTITARVQEVLEFCVGNTDADTAGNDTDNCTDITGSTIDMGVLDAGSITESSDSVGSGESHGYLMMRTNGLNGLNLSYLGGLLTSGSNTIAAIGGTEATITQGTTAFGIDVVNVDNNAEASSAIDETNGSGTGALTLDTDWDTFDLWTYVGSATVADTIATAGSVVDDEMLILDFGGTVSNLVPTGLYTTTITFIATGLF